MKIFLILWLFFLLVLFGMSGKIYDQSENLRFVHLTEQQGLSQNSVWSIHQDSEGFMWFGTQDGLNKYDGYSFTVLKPDPQDPEHTLHHNIISDIHEDRKGRLWATTLGGGLHLVDKHTGRITRYGISPTHSVRWNGLASIYEDYQGFLWISGFGGVARFDPQTKKFTLYAVPAEIVWLTSVIIDSVNRFWAAGSGGVYQLNRSTGKYTPVVLDSSLDRQPDCWSLFLDKEGILWAGTGEEGLFRMDTRHIPLQFIRYNPGGLVSKSFRLNSIYEDTHGYLWLSGSEGLQRIDKKTNQVFNFQPNPFQPITLSHHNVSSVYQDRKGTLWIGTDNGISKVTTHAKKFQTHKIIPALPSVILHENTISTLLEDYTGKIWLGSAGSSLNGNFENGLFQFDPRSRKIKHIQANASDAGSLVSNQVWSLYEDQHKRLWVGTEEALHLYDRNTGKFSRYPSNIPVEQIDEDAYGKLWIGGRSTFNTGSGGIASFNPEERTFRYYMYDPRDTTGLKDGDVYDIIVSGGGDVWVALSGGGIARLNPQTGQFTSYLPSSNASLGHLNDKDVRVLYEHPEGVIWAGTNQGGLHRFDTLTNTFTYFTTKDGLPTNHIESITCDTKGNLWLGTNKGISRFNPDTRTFRNYDVSDGLPAYDFKLGSVYSRNGRLMFGSGNGFVIFYPDSIQDNTIIPPVYITAFKVLEQTRDVPAAKVELPHDENFLSFDFVALNYDTPEKNQYAYRLDGIDKDWVYCGTRRFASYPNLDPGEYVFRVKGSNNDGMWNEQGASIRLTISPPWWKTWWAYTLYVLLLAAGIGYLVRYRSRSLLRELDQKEKEKQLAQLRQKTAELQQQATELEMQALRAQMNPHFIFNCLSSINRFILKNESEAASDYLTKFSRLIRMVLTNSKKTFITIEEELEMLKLYLEMERLRFKYSFDYSISFTNEIDTESIFIPPLLLQPFAENAIWHGLMNKESQGLLLVFLSKENDILTCVIEDNGIGRARAAELKSKSAEKKKSMGLQITKERLALLNQETNQNTYFEIEDLFNEQGNATGTRVILKIRFLEKQEENTLIS